MAMPGLLEGLRALELGHHKVEWCGRLLAGLGVEVIKIEPPEGARSRRIGPFYSEKRPDPEESLHFWQYNLGKRSVVLDLASDQGLRSAQRLLGGVDIVLEGLQLAGLAEEDAALGSSLLRLASESERERLVWLAMSDFGLTGPWRSLHASDLTHLGLGGQMMVMGYAPSREGEVVPPMAPQMWQSYQIAGQQACMDVVAAVAYAEQQPAGTGGQLIDFSIHAACNLCTESMLAQYMMGSPGTGRHSRQSQVREELRAADGVYIQTIVPLFAGEREHLIELVTGGGATSLSDDDLDRLTCEYINTHDSEEIFHEAQRLGVVWAPVRPPHGSLSDEHFVGRDTFVEVEHERVGRSLPYAARPWISFETDWRATRAPHLGEHTGTILADTVD